MVTPLIGRTGAAVWRGWWVSVEGRTDEGHPRADWVGRSRTGLGLFAIAVIEKGSFIIDDIGPRITNAEVTTRPQARSVFAVNNRSTIDGPPLGNTVSFINHACHPNAEAQEARGKIKTVPTRRVLLRSSGTRILSVPGSGA